MNLRDLISVFCHPTFAPTIPIVTNPTIGAQDSSRQQSPPGDTDSRTSSPRVTSSHSFRVEDSWDLRSHPGEPNTGQLQGHTTHSFKQHCPSRRNTAQDRQSNFIKIHPIKIHPREASSLWLSSFGPSDFADRELSECQKQSISHFQGLTVNKFMKLHHGNTSLYCPKCNCFMGHHFFFNSPKKLHSNHSNPLRLQNGMMVHHVKYCHNHTFSCFF